MCGFVGAFEITGEPELLRDQVLQMAKKIRHRGPDWSGVHCANNAILAHERLAIVDPFSGNSLFSARMEKSP